VKINNRRRKKEEYRIEKEEKILENQPRSSVSSIKTPSFSFFFILLS